MHLLFVSDVSIARVIGGAERVLYEQCTRLVRKGHEVHVLTRRLPSHETDSETVAGVREWRYAVNWTSSPPFFTTTLRNGRRLFEGIQKEVSFDILNFHQPFSAYAVLRSRDSLKMPIIYTCHSLAFEEFRSRNRMPSNPLGRVIYGVNLQMRKFIERKALAASDRFVVLSRFTAEKLEEVYGVPVSRSRIIPGGADLEKFRPPRGGAERMAIRRRLTLPENRVILFTVRNLVPRMGLDQLLYAVKEVAGVHPDVLLVIGGSGPLRNSLVALVEDLGLSDHVLFAGFIPEKMLPDYYRMADLFVLPTVELEGFGLITPEALASGLPVVGTPVGGTREILGRFDESFLFGDATARTMAEKIIEKIDAFRANPALREEIAARCRVFAEQHYSWERNVEELEEVFLDVHSGGRG
ncbi:MAG TPA: glycosyltransferase family 4 protein [Deltaproteobacteria bacterium]|nr:glycosyltransferase family 4 protein [Deltaproteobacteria bacterium]